MYQFFNKKNLFILVLYYLLPTGWLCSQTKVVKAVWVDTFPRIDGYLDEPVWARAQGVEDFVQFSPVPDQAPSFRTNVRVLYSKKSVYIGAIMYDPAPDSILKQLSVRDEIGSVNADNFGVYIDAMSTKQQDFGFIVTAAGVQYDDNAGDEVWDAAWKSKVRIYSEGWSVEMEIPYSQLRFPPSDSQRWGINFVRYVRRIRETSWWARLDPTIDNQTQFFGVLEGINGVRPPLRLSLTPYVASYLRVIKDQNPQTPVVEPALTAGTDIKYGVNQSFTLDMSLIPDFGNVQFDNLEYNLSPFEIYYAERRPFFTEGTELFNKAGLFYSRRVGGEPPRTNWAIRQRQPQETVLNAPLVSQLINASKFSGRTKKRLGIGVFNALTAPAYLTFQSTNLETRRIQTAPFINYNLLVLDQQFGRNSYVSLVQTNVIRFGGFADAFVLGTDFRVVDKKNLFGVEGNAAYSHIFGDTALSTTPNPRQQGYRYTVAFRKLKGNFRFGISQSNISKNFNINDMGYITVVNNFNTTGKFSYNLFKPIGVFNRIGGMLTILNDCLYAPFRFAKLDITLAANSTTRKFMSSGFDLTYQPWGYVDFYEARDNFRAWKKPTWGRVGLWFSSDYRKKFALDGSASFRNFFAGKDSIWAGAYVLEMTLSPRFRINDRLNFILSNNIIFRPNNIGYVTRNPAYGVVFGSRYRQDMTSTIELNYLFTELSSLSFRVRHYWSYVRYERFYSLDNLGEHSVIGYNGDHNRRYNAFNIDLVYRWRFAPGSELNIVWKNSILDVQNQLLYDYFDNLKTMLASDQTNVFTLKVLYFLDAGTWLSRKK